MPELKIDIDGQTRVAEVPMGKRLVNALEDEGKVDQLHSCGGNAKCTSCRVEFISGEPAKWTQAEKDVLGAKGVSGVRLSCQMKLEADAEVKVISRLTGSTKKDAGGRCSDEIAPPPVWI